MGRETAWSRSESSGSAHAGNPRFTLFEKRGFPNSDAQTARLRSRCQTIGNGVGLNQQSQSIPNSFHFLSTSALVLASMRISSGQGRVKPSLAHLRVAPMPIFDPKLGRREA